MVKTATCKFDHILGIIFHFSATQLFGELFRRPSILTLT